MKQFLVMAYDYKDALPRRMATREAHLKMVSELRAKGNAILGAAILDENEHMIGSVITAAFPSRTELDAWLKVEPYIVNKVWENVTVQNCKIAPTFADLI